MGQGGIPRDVQKLVRDHLKSLAQLEILLLLHAEPSRSFTADQVADTLRIDASWAGAELARLHEQGLFAEVDDSGRGYCYRPARTDEAETVDRLSRLFATHRVSIITLIFAAPSDSIGSFADAFKLRSDDDG